MKFNSFEDAYKNKDQIQNEINKKTGKDIELDFDDSLISYYGVENNTLQNFMSKAVILLSVVGCVVIFIFFTKNIFLVWGLRKIRELSIYKSIGSTDFQIYLSLLKEGIFLSIIPLILGHILGFTFIYYLYKNIQETSGISYFENVSFNLFLSLAIVLVALIVVAFAIMSPAKKIAKINIIDGIRGNINFSKSKKKKFKDLWKELKLNNLNSIKSQRYISSVGIIIISVFIISMSIIKYYSDFRYFYDGYNILVEYDSKNQEIPNVLNQIIEKIPNQGAYISREKYVRVKSDLELSDEAKKANLKEEIDENLKKYNTEYYDGFIIALEDKDLKKLGGNKGEFILYNMVQEDSSMPISKAKKIPYFKNPANLKIKFANDYETKIKISKTIDDMGNYKSITMPFDIKIYTDFDTFTRLMKTSEDVKNRNYSYDLHMAVDENEINSAKSYIENAIRSELSSSDRFNISTDLDIKEDSEKEQQGFAKLVIGIGMIIFILNVTNGYSSINLSLMSRKKEIGTLYSCGMDLDELKSTYLGEFIEEQIKSFIFAILISLGVMFAISIFSSSLTMKNLLLYYDYKLFLGFSLIVYGINLLIYHFSLKRILDRPTIDLIRTI